MICFLTVATGAATFAWFASYRSPGAATIYFEKGSSLRKISLTLEENKMVPSAVGFELMARLKGKGGKLKAGEYEFPAGSRPGDILRTMVEGKVKLYSVTIPEGFSLREIGAVLHRNGLTTVSEWEQLVRDPRLIAETGTNSATLEGYLFPDTYLYEKRATAKDLIRQMTDLFKKKAMPDLIAEAKQKGMTLNQWVTLASIVEKETGVPSERPLIASVFQNRLQKGMLLQSDPTVIYGIPNFNGNLTRADLERDSPYNTYMRPGLPPGPICSPGLDSLMAALRPAQTGYLYFVAKGDGSHYFSTNLEEHNRAVTYYQLKRGTRP
ncbi:MAG: endolytic transglycosylase MltG [Deltaproteobacteria bacterium]|nr:endolytic transglycosylase MltG [Deltaproteobacteria bacterium]